MSEAEHYRAPALAWYDLTAVRDWEGLRALAHPDIDFTEPWEAEHFQEMYQMFRDSESEYVTDDVKRVTGNDPGTIEGYLEANADVFREGVSE